MEQFLLTLDWLSYFVDWFLQVIVFLSPQIQILYINSKFRQDAKKIVKQYNENKNENNSNQKFKFNSSIRARTENVKIRNIQLIQIIINLLQMKIGHTLIFALLLFTIAAYKNNTKFWQRQLNLTSEIHFQSYSGFQEIDWYYPKGTSGMFYNLFGAAGHDVMNATDEEPLIIWLQGGPGSGSQFGAFTQVGPIRIEKGVPKMTASPWNHMGHTLFIDSPLNAGFSFRGDRHGKDQVSSTGQATDHLINFLSNFYTEFPSLKHCPLYITGQSFAGHYIPNLAKKILNNDTFLNKTGVKLVGIAIGDGWTDPINQINFYDSFLWSVGVIEQKFRQVCTWYQTQSIMNIYEGKYQNATNYFDFLTNNDTTPEVYWGNISTYNFRNYDGLDLSFAQFLSNNKAQFGSQHDYLPGNEAIYTAFGNDVSRSYAPDVITALRSIKVLIYNGQNDVVVNTPGVLLYLNSLNWEGIARWKRQPKQIWTRFGEVRGWAKVSGNLWFVLVNGAGHMVPTDAPDAAYSMLGHFIHNERDWKQ